MPFMNGEKKMSVSEIVCSKIADFIGRTGIVPWYNQRPLFRNFTSEAPLGVLNQSLLFIHQHENNLNGIFYGTWNQIKEFNGRINHGSLGALTTYYKNSVDEGKDFPQLNYYYSYNLQNTNLQKDFFHLENEYLFMDFRDEANQLIDKGLEKLNQEPLKNEYPCVDDYFCESIKRLVELVPGKDSLVNELASAYLLNKCGYKLKTKSYSREQANSIAQLIRGSPGKFIKQCANAQKKINYLLN